jgi:hypothetical protein
MATYEETVLADTPALYYRLDMVGAAVNGDTIPDLSGNNLHGTLEFIQPGTTPEPYGYPSPIETDEGSREFRGFNQGTFSSTRVARIGRASDSQIEPDGDFALEGWLRLPNATGGSAAFGTIMQVMFGRTGSIFAYIDHFNFIAGCVIDTAGTGWLIVSPTPVEYGVSYHTVIERLGNALILKINGVLQNFTTITSGLPNRMDAPGTFLNASGGIQQLPAFFVHPYQIAQMDARYDEIAFYNAALGSRAAAHYEAALNTLELRGTCNIRTSVQLDGSDDPDPVAYPFRHNWSEPVIERLRWRTSLFKPENGSTEFARQRSALRRSVEYQHLLYNENLRRQFEARSFGGRKSLVQFEPDKVQVASLPAATTAVTFDTVHMDFEVGHYALIWQDDDTYEYKLLTAVDDSGVQWDGNLTRDYVNPWLKPARIARLPASQDMDAETDTIGNASTIYEYQLEDEPLNSRRITPFVETLTYRDREVFDLREWQGHDYSEIPKIEFAADRAELDFGTGVVSQKQYRWGAEQITPYNMNLQGRPLIAKYLGWLYRRAGMNTPFWMPTFRQDLEPLLGDTLDLTVRGHEYTQLYAPADNRIDLAFVYFDSTVIMRRIEAAVADGMNDLLTLDAAVPTFTNLRWLCFLRRVILSSDDLEIAWETDNVVQVAFAVRDAPLDWALGSPSVSPSPSPSLSLSPSPSHSASGSVSPSGSASPSHSASPSV